MPPGSGSVDNDCVHRHVSGQQISLHEARRGKCLGAQYRVDGYVAPQLHTHVVFFNVTELENGDTRPLQPQEPYRTQQYATAVYRSELAMHLRELGYEIEPGASGAPEIRGYSAEYLEASSPRRH
jgi:conjugative relaxase-like TrwC/TraI family protein